MSDAETYEGWKARIRRERVLDPPVVFAGNWARKAIEDLESERDALRALYIEENNERARLAEQLAGAVDDARALVRLGMVREERMTYADWQEWTALSLKYGPAGG